MQTADGIVLFHLPAETVGRGGLDKLGPVARGNGGVTGGPPLSIHLSLKRLFASSVSQVIRTSPPAADSAPCLAAFVASSCRTKLRDMIVRGASSMALPGSITTAWGLVA